MSIRRLLEKDLAMCQHVTKVISRIYQRILKVVKRHQGSSSKERYLQDYQEEKQERGRK